MMRIIKILDKIFCWGNQGKEPSNWSPSNKQNIMTFCEESFPIRVRNRPRKERHRKRNYFYPYKWMGRVIEFRRAGTLHENQDVFRGKIIDVAYKIALVEVYKKGTIMTKNMPKFDRFNRPRFYNSHYLKKTHIIFNEDLEKKILYLVKWADGKWKPIAEIKKSPFDYNWRYFQDEKYWLRRQPPDRLTQKWLQRKEEK